jgi:csr/mutH/archaeal HJR family nuclease
MLKESGNLLAENIPITKDLLDFALANNYKISLKTGDYGLEVQNKGKYNIDLISQINYLYLNGLMYPRKYCNIFMVSATRMVDELFRLKGFKTLSCTEAKQVYRAEVNEQTKKTFIERIGVDHNSKLPNRPKPKFTAESLEKRRQTNLKRYGVDHPMKLQEFKDKVVATLLARYGVTHNMLIPEVREKYRQTLLKRYGADHPMRIEEFRLKATAKMMETMNYRYSGIGFGSEYIRSKMEFTMMQRYGVVNASSSPILRTKIIEAVKLSNIENYGVPSVLSLPEVRARISKTRALKYDFGNPFTYDGPTIKGGTLEALMLIVKGEKPKEYVFELDLPYYQMLRYATLLGARVPHKFLTEVKLCNFLDSLGIEYIHRAKSAHQVRNANNEYYELDVFIPSLNLGIEINGLGYHSVNKHPYDDPKTPEWHFEKFKAFHESGILMLSFTDHEQEHFTEDYINIIKHHIIKEPLNISKEFLEFNQISSIEESLNYGLFDPSRFTGNFEDHQHQRFIEDFEYWDCGVIK